MIEENKQLYIDCLKFWGVEDQMRQCQEECAELICAISHYIRATKRPDMPQEEFILRENDVVEEIADALLMLEQLMTYMGEHKVVDTALAKASKVRTKLEKYKAEMGPEDDTF